MSGSTSNTLKAAPAPEHPKDIVQRLLWALKPIAALRKSGSVPLPYALVFLTVALDEGKPVGAYAHEMGLSRYVMTRYMQCIGDRGRNDRAGLGLVTVKRSTGYPTRTEVFLTEKGRALFAAVLSGARFSPRRK
jgi:hypothetical protein